MATTTTQMVATTTPDDWTLQAGGSKVAAVNTPDDGNSSYIRSPVSSGNEQWFTATPDMPDGSTITEIAVRVRAARGGVSNADFTTGYQFTPQGGGSQSGTSTAYTAVGAYADYTYTHSGLSVVWGSDLKVWIRNTQALSVSATTLEITFTYTPPAGHPVAARGRQVPGMRRPHGQQGW